jgi:hypothetical protein
MNKQRLIEAADWAEKNINPQQFDMERFRSGNRGNPECDSIGCMVGHLTAIDAKNIMENYITSDIGIKFAKWSRDYFEVEGYKWNYLFSPAWTEVDNTLSGAIARMRRLANGMSKEEILQGLENIRL